MKFGKIVLAAFLGTLIALVINFFIKVGVISSMISSFSKSDTESSTTVKPNSLLYMKLDYSIPDRTVDDPLGSFNFNSMETKESTGMTTILHNFHGHPSGNS